MPIEKRRPFCHPDAVTDTGEVAVLQVEVPEIDGHFGDEVFLMAGPIATLSIELAWLVSKDGDKCALVPKEDLLMQVYGYDGVETLGPTPSPLSEKDFYQPAVLLANILGTIWRAGDLGVIIDQGRDEGFFWIERYVTHDLAEVHESLLCLVEHLSSCSAE